MSPYDISLAVAIPRANPYVLHVGGQEYRVDYTPGESKHGHVRGNSNWRGPIWLPVNILIIRALVEFYLYYGDDFQLNVRLGPAR